MKGQANPTSELRTQLTKTSEFLEGIGDRFWSSRMQQMVARAAVDPVEVLSWYGGMGSFNDFLIARVNGHQVERGNEDAANEKLNEMRRKIYELAVELTE